MMVGRMRMKYGHGFYRRRMMVGRRRFACRHMQMRSASFKWRFLRTG